MVTSSALLATGALECDLSLRNYMKLMHRVIGKTNKHIGGFNEEHRKKFPRWGAHMAAYQVSLDEKAWREMAQALH